MVESPQHLATWNPKKRSVKRRIKTAIKPLLPKAFFRAREARLAAEFDSVWQNYLETKTGAEYIAALNEYNGIDCETPEARDGYRPISSLYGQNSLISNPEGIEFSACGELVAIADAGSCKTLLFRVADCLSANNNIEPVAILDLPKNSESYFHDVAFSPDGTHLAITNRNANQVTVHRKSTDERIFERTPFAVIDGDAAGLDCITAAKYSPNGNCLGVCDCVGHQVALFRRNGETYERQPYQRMARPGNVLRIPDGLAFSKDGKILAVTNGGTHGVLLFERLSGTEDQYSSSEVQALLHDQAPLNSTHSVAFNPLDDTLIVTCHMPMQSVFVFKKIAPKAPHFSSEPSQILNIYNRDTIHLRKTSHGRGQGGVKGAAFSPDGKILAICASEIGSSGRIQFHAFDDGMVVSKAVTQENARALC